ncbi:MAG: transcriptional regulator [Sphaerochaetaceae bacterium]|nr:transcriptional regulator [Sphaerochaetaceae bacterium]MDD3163586.1 transcriptional regulator [Sphaerochaetaceae bacterium]MDD4007807.1 transcriptional regulator [Sphaerochaetaceae bacterium]
MDFQKALNRAKVQSVLSRFKGANPELLSFYTVTNLIHPKNECYVGLRPIKISDIIGSEGRYNDFSSAFFPKRRELKNRWESIERANANDVILPPISVYQVGDKYFVRDGNHRVSVAKSLGVEYIDADIVKIDSEIKLSSGMTTHDIITEVCQYERSRFIEQYHADQLFPMDQIVFTSIGAYPELVQHILVHKYFINMDKDYEVSFDYAARSWYELMYKPICDAIDKDHMLMHFPGKTKADLYMWIIRHWDNLKKKNPGISIKDASDDYERKFGKGTIRRWIKVVIQRFGKNQ